MDVKGGEVGKQTKIHSRHELKTKPELSLLK